MMSKSRITYIVLGIFLIFSGLVDLVTALGDLGILSAILALAAGVLILLFHPDTSHRIGWILAAVYLIALGLVALISLSFTGLGTIMAVLALAAGIFLLIKAPSFRHHIGFFLFCLWLILSGLLGLVDLGQLSIVVAIVAIAAGVLVILDE
jgi:hypothetical protein